MNELKVDSILLKFGDKLVLSDIYLTLQTGQVAGILGRNGAGKSSLFKVIYGILNPTDSFISINNKRGIKPYLTPGIMGFLPQDDFIPGRLTIGRVIELFGIEEDALHEDFPVYGKLLRAKLNTLSGGERRLLETYVVLKCCTDFVLLDEPFSYLMPLHVEKLKDIIRYEKERKGIIITDHMYKNVEEVSDMLYVLNDGKLFSAKDETRLVELGYLNKKQV